MNKCQWLCENGGKEKQEENNKGYKVNWNWREKLIQNLLKRVKKERMQNGEMNTEWGINIEILNEN
jgi:hypothetical protein